MDNNHFDYYQVTLVNKLIDYYQMEKTYSYAKKPGRLFAYINTLNFKHKTLVKWIIKLYF